MTLLQKLLNLPSFKLQPEMLWSSNRGTAMLKVPAASMVRRGPPPFPVEYTHGWPYVTK